MGVDKPTILVKETETDDVIAQKTFDWNSGYYTLNFSIEDTTSLYFVISCNLNYAHYKYIDDITITSENGRLIESGYDVSPSEYPYLTFFVHDDDKTAEVVTCNNRGLSGKLTIPQTIKIDGTDYSVNSIWSKAFDGCTNITDVELPSSIDTISYLAFSGCSSLKNVVVNSGVKHICKKAFTNCNNLESMLILSNTCTIEDDIISSNKLTIHVPSIKAYSDYTEKYSIKGLAYLDEVLTYTGTIPSLKYSSCQGITAKIDDSGLGKDAGYYSLPAIYTHENGTKVTGYLDFTINKKELIVTANDAERLYGDPEPAFSASYSGFVDGEDEQSLISQPSIKPSCSIKSDVGYYPILASDAKSNNYYFTYKEGYLLIKKATITVSVSPVTRLYGDENPQFELNYIGLKNNETSSVFEILPSVKTVATQSSTIGTYALVIQGGSAKNYTFEYINSEITIKPAPLVIIANNTSREYGDENGVFSYTLNGLKNNEGENSLTQKPELMTSATNYSDVGEYEIVPSNAKAQNYEISYKNGILNVTPCTLLAYAGKYERCYGEENPTFIIKYTGLKNNDDATVIDKLPTVSCEAISISNCGVYDVVISGGNDNNYNLIYENGTLTINKADQTITWQQDFSQSFLVGDKVKLVAKASSGLDVNYIIDNSNIATVVNIGNDSFLELKEYGEFTITANQDGNVNYNAALPIVKNLKFTDPEGGINDVTQSNDVVVSVEKNSIYVTGNLGDDMIYIYTLSGSLLKSIRANGESACIEGLAPGIYIIKVKNRSLKVSV